MKIEFTKNGFEIEDETNIESITVESIGEARTMVIKMKDTHDRIDLGNLHKDATT